MFDDLPDLAALAEADDATVVAAIEGWARAESAAAARRLAAIAELTARRTADEDDERVLWACDQWDSAAAEVSAALGVSHRRASTQMRLGAALRDRLPRTAEMLARGVIDARVASTISWRTALVEDSEAIAVIDAAIAGHAASWGPLSDNYLNLAIDAVMEAHDPDAQRNFHTAARGRDVQFGKPEDNTGTASMWGRLYSTDALLLERRLADMISALCRDDPRTLGERRADALGALASGTDRLACKCGSSDCPGSATASRAGSVVIHVVAEQAAVEAQSQSTSTTPAKPTFKAAVVVGGGVVPTPLLAELINAGATLRPLPTPCATTERQHRPTRTLEDFVRARDLTCRFPGCNRPAEYADIDHTLAYPHGPTHPSNLKCLCRKHHLLKTFWTGPGGWSDRQYPDGRVVWTSPTGRTYTTYPGSRILLPQWNTETAPLSPPTTPTATATLGNRGVMMPKRRRTRAADRAQSIKAERALNNSR